MPTPGLTRWRAACGLVALLGLSACADLASPPGASCLSSEADLLGGVDTRELAGLLAEGLCPAPDPVVAGGEAALLVVADPVDVHSFQPGPLGRAFGEVFRSAVLRQCRVPLRQVELSREFHLGAQGMTALTRDLRGVSQPQFAAREALITTYSVQRQRVVFVARRVDIASGAIAAMNARELSWQCRTDLRGQPGVQATIR